MAGWNNPTEQAQQFWASRSGKQKTLLLGGAGVTILLLTIFVKFIGTPDYKPLFTGLEPEDAQTLSTQLEAQGIPHQLSPDGKTLSVPADKLDAARMQTAAQGQPHSGHMGFELFDKVSWGETEFDEKVTYQRALEGELERSIETLADVESARVHLVMPTESVFLDQQRAAKASVIVKLRHGQMSKTAVLAIARLVSGAVDQMTPDQVSIVNADTDQSLNHTGPDDGSTEGSTLTDRLISTLEPIVGADKIRATVNVDYDQGTTDESQEKYDPAVSALLSDQKSDEQAGSGAIPSGVPGTSSNIPAAKPAKNGSNPPTTTSAAQAVNSQHSTTESAQYGVNKTIVHTVTPAGRIARLSAAILVDDELVKSTQKGKVTWTRQKRSQEQLDKIRDLAEAAIGFDAKRGDTISVQAMPFDTDVTDADVPTRNLGVQVQKAVSDYSPLLRPVSLLALFGLAYLFVIRPVQKHVLAPGQAPARIEAALPAATGELSGGVTHTLGSGTARAAQLKEQTADLIRKNPVQTARALQAWLREEPS
ncbi:MAG TPA: flagellar basal-body MS-ring/collar protein FliF [Acidobacteriaceae bacterium]|nr:flagellar basal-body MS-ring/collar protein FliF [Acidobacteriaceae bacterium]